MRRLRDLRGRHGEYGLLLGDVLYGWTNGRQRIHCEEILTYRTSTPFQTPTCGLGMAFQLWAKSCPRVLADLLIKYDLPHWMRFRYLQLRHAARAQFSRLPLLQADLIEELLAPGDLTKPLSTLCGALLGTDSPKLERLWDTWHRDITLLNREGWEDCLEYGPKLVISSNDKLIQVKFLPRIYYTPQKLHQIFLDRDPVCPRCKTHIGTFFHMFWDCSIVLTY